MPTWQAVLVGIIPSIGVGLIFWFAIRSVVRADRNERAALARLEADQDAADARHAAAASAASAEASQPAVSDSPAEDNRA